MIQRRIFMKILLSTPLGAWFRSRGGVAVASIDGSELDAVPHYRQAFAWITNLSLDDEAIVHGWKTIALDREVKALLHRASSALASWRNGTSLARCDWDEIVSGESLTKDQLDFRNHRIARLALLRSRLLLAQGREQEALDDILAVVRFARHVTTSGVLIAQLYSFSLEIQAVDCLALALPQLSDTSLKALPARLDALPPPCSWPEIMRLESNFVVRNCRDHKDASKPPKDEIEAFLQDFTESSEAKIRKVTNGDPSRRRELVDKVPTLLVELGDLLEQPADSSKPQLEAFKAKVEETNPIVAHVMESATSARYARDRVSVLWVMLRAAIARLSLGEEAFLAIRDPFGEGPFTSLPCGNGFELRSALHMEAKPPAVLIVGAGDSDAETPVGSP